MRDVAIKKICRRLEEEHNTVLKDIVALDFFARTGDWQTSHYASKVKKVHAWEIDPRHEQTLKDNLPIGSEIKIGNSFHFASSTNEKFDMIVIDNPQMCFGLDNRYCEHFDALDPCLALLKNTTGIMIFNIKTEPFNYSNKLSWQERRNNFYSLDDASCLSEQFVISFYEKYFLDRGYKTNFSFLEQRPQEPGLYAYTTQLVHL